MHWTRGHGLGNDYLVVEPAALPLGVALTSGTVRLICDHHRGIGSDGILELLPPTGTPERFALRIWNPDGSVAEKSGNGIRIFAKYLHEHGHTIATEFIVATPGGEAAVALARAVGAESLSEESGGQAGRSMGSFAATTTAARRPETLVVRRSSGPSGVHVASTTLRIHAAD